MGNFKPAIIQYLSYLHIIMLGQVDVITDEEEIAEYLGLSHEEYTNKLISFGGFMPKTYSIIAFKNQDQIITAKEWIDSILIARKLNNGYN